MFTIGESKKLSWQLISSGRIGGLSSSQNGRSLFGFKGEENNNSI